MSADESRGRPMQTNAPLSVTVQEAATIAVQCLEDLTYKTSNGAVAVIPNDEGWTVSVEVVEVRRVPPATDILGLYEVEVGPRGFVRSYRRIRRYRRGDKDPSGSESTEKPEDTGETSPGPLPASAVS